MVWKEVQCKVFDLPMMTPSIRTTKFWVRFAGLHLLGQVSWLGLLGRVCLVGFAGPCIYWKYVYLYCVGNLLLSLLVS